jgi:hypothetical protein
MGKNRSPSTRSVPCRVVVHVDGPPGVCATLVPAVPRREATTRTASLGKIDMSRHI